MTVNLSTLLFRVRSNVAEITPDNMDDLTMYRQLKQASDYVDKIKIQTVIDTDLETPMVCLAAYYSFATYILLNSRQLGTVDESTLARQNELKRIARAMLQTISASDIDSNLAINDIRYEKMGGLAFAPTMGVLNDRRF